MQQQKMYVVLIASTDEGMITLAGTKEKLAKENPENLFADFGCEVDDEGVGQYGEFLVRGDEVTLGHVPDCFMMKGY